MNAKSCRKYHEVDYDSLRRAARHYEGEAEYCAVIALAIASGCKFGKARAILKRQGRGTGQGTYRWQTMDALEEAGMRVKQYHNVRGVLRKAADHLPSTGIFYVFVSGHIACVRDGVLHDWSADGLRGSNYRIMEVWELEYSH